MRLAPLFIATSLATILAGNMAAMGSAHAAAMDAKDVTMMLARAQTLDSRCKILSANESQDLRDLVARAEIALAGRYSVSVARETLSRGRADGKAAACDTAATSQVRDILKAGVQATLEAPVGTKAAQPMAAAVAKPEPATKLVPKKVTIVAQKPAAPVKLKKKSPTPVLAQAKTQVTTEIKSKEKVSLASYTDLAEKYYVELKCHTMPLQTAKRMYEEVLTQHRAAIASEGMPAVRKMLKGAQSRAGLQNCA